MGLTQYEMAERLGICEDTLSQLERNLLIPGSNVLRKISAESGMSRESLILMNLSAPKELSREYRSMFDKVQGELIKEFVRKQVLE
jgi:transcriptional regulator with XRE-family HTH domain